MQDQELKKILSEFTLKEIQYFAKEFKNIPDHIQNDKNLLMDYLIAKRHIANGFTNIKILDQLILLDLTLPDMAKVCRTNSYFRNICLDDYFWKLKVEKDIHPSLLQIKKPNETFKEFYKRQHYSNVMIKIILLKDQGFYFCILPSANSNYKSPTLLGTWTTKVYKTKKYLDTIFFYINHDSEIVSSVWDNHKEAQEWIQTKENPEDYILIHTWLKFC